APDARRHLLPHLDRTGRRPPPAHHGDGPGHRRRHADRAPGRDRGAQRLTSRSAAAAVAGTAGERGATGATGCEGAASGGAGAGAPTVGQGAIARSASAGMVSDGFTPRLAATADPSTTCRPSYP